MYMMNIVLEKYLYLFVLLMIEACKIIGIEMKKKKAKKDHKRMTTTRKK
jgi:hypothetical protein